MKKKYPLPFSIMELQRHQHEGLVRGIRHPCLPLMLFNYTQKAQIGWHWTPVTRLCRGLILDMDYNIVSRPFPKFFTAEQLRDQGVPLPQGKFEILEKLDGSLGICYPSPAGPTLATRGSFESHQAMTGTEILRARITLDFLPPDRTYLFEIIYPENQIIVDYGKASKIVLIGIIDKASGSSLPLEDIGFPIVESYSHATKIKELQAEDRPGHEGYVVRYFDNQGSDFRVKIKHPWYVAAHQLLNLCTPGATWKVLSRGEDLEDILDNSDLPADKKKEIRNFACALWDEYEVLEAECRAALESVVADPLLQHKTGPVLRKEMAMQIKKFLHKAIIFAMLDGKEYSSLIWKRLKPKARP